MKRVYLEATIVSYLTARSSRNLLAAAWQEITKEWWDHRRSEFDLFTSTLVRDEAGQGDAEAAQRRLEQLENIPSLSITDSAIDFAKILINELVVKGFDLRFKLNGDQRRHIQGRPQILIAGLADETGSVYRRARLTRLGITPGNRL